MKELKVKLNHTSYPIYIGSGLLQQNNLFKKHIHSKQILIVTNTTVAPLYLKSVLGCLDDFQAEIIQLPDGEQFKNLTHINKIFTCLLKKRYDRKATLIALGGGVIGDMTGFAAACYQRGISYLQVPTTILAQVDSSVGGKTGVNHPLGKNMIGAFYQPKCVIIDISVLATLPHRHFVAGIAEIIKYGLIQDYKFFLWLEKNIQLLLSRDKNALMYAIEHSCLSKAKIVVEDEFESGIRSILNLGHTFAHAIETGTKYKQFLHGEAVAIGICYAAELSKRIGWLKEYEANRITTLLKSADLPTIAPKQLTATKFIKLMSVDKKNVAGEIRLILLKTIGKATLPIKVKPDLLQDTLKHFAHSE